VTLTDTIGASAAALNALDLQTTGVINAGSITSLAGSASDVTAAFAANTGGTISGLGNEAVNLNDVALAVANLNAVDAGTTGVVDATTITSLTGTGAALNTAYAANTAGQITALGDETVTLTDTTLAATVLATLNGNTTGTVNAGTVTTVTGTAADVTAALTAGGTAGFGAVAVTLSDASATIAALTAANGATTGTVTYTATVTTTTGADVFDLNTGFDAGAHTVQYTAANQATAAAFSADNAGAGLADTDAFTLSGAIDELTFDGNDVLNLTSFGLFTQSADAQFGAVGSKVGDGEYKMVRGTQAGATFTVDSAGADLLVIWDGNTAAVAVSQVGVVIHGVTSLTPGSTLLV
jgi:hypothetical protein